MPSPTPQTEKTELEKNAKNDIRIGALITIGAICALPFALPGAPLVACTGVLLTLNGVRRQAQAKKSLKN